MPSAWTVRRIFSSWPENASAAAVASTVFTSHSTSRLALSTSTPNGRIKSNPAWNALRGNCAALERTVKTTPPTRHLCRARAHLRWGQRERYVLRFACIIQPHSQPSRDRPVEGTREQVVDKHRALRRGFRFLSHGSEHASSTACQLDAVSGKYASSGPLRRDVTVNTSPRSPDAPFHVKFVDSTLRLESTWHGSPQSGH